jgi:hypothetical protein
MTKKANPLTEEKTRKKPGPVANLDLVTTSIKIESDLLEWGKNQSGGLSALVRRLLREAKEQAEPRAGN